MPVYFTDSFADSTSTAWRRYADTVQPRMCLAVNVENGAVSQLWDHHFNSICKIGNTYYGANEAGLWELGGDTMDGGAIDAWFELYLDLQTVVRLFSLWQNVEADGPLEITMTFDDQEDDARTQTLTPHYYNNQQHGLLHYPGSGDEGRLLRLRCGNQVGADFSWDAMDAEIIDRGPFHT